MCCNDKYLLHLKAINELYDNLNKAFFESALSKPVITIQRDTKCNALGWFTPRESWQAENETSPEINITANFLDRQPIEIAETMLHEMCHYYAYKHNIQDCSRGNAYHNKEYKKIAESHGLTVEKTPKGGWNYTKLTNSSQVKIEPFLKTLQALKRTEVLKVSGTKQSSTRKYTCPECGQTVRATKEVNIMCGDCEETMTLEN